MVVIAQALVLLVALCSKNFNRTYSHTDSPKKRAFSDINGGLKTVLRIFKEDCGRYPTTAEGLKLLFAPPADGSLTNWRGPYLDPSEVPKDPWGHEYVYRCPALYSTNGYDLYSLGRDGISKTDGHDPDDIGNWYTLSSAPAGMTVYRETLSDRISRWLFFSPLLVPVLFAVRLIAGILSRRVRALMAENPLADRIWLWMSLAAVFIWFSTFVSQVVGR